MTSVANTILFEGMLKDEAYGHQKHIAEIIRDMDTKCGMRISTTADLLDYIADKFLADVK